MTSAASARDDPYYLDGPARWYRTFVERHTRISILIEDTLGPQPVAASREERIIWIMPGLPFTTFRNLISDGVAYVNFGEDAAPMFSPAPNRPWLAASDGVTQIRPA